MLYNTKIIDYGDFIHVEHFDNPIRRSDNTEDIQVDNQEMERAVIISDFPDDKETEEEKLIHSLSVSTNRSKNNLFRIARSNKWDLFITLTFDRELVDSSDYELVSKKVSKWLNNLKLRYCSDLKYLIVPELHKDKIHYHFHGLFSIFNINLNFFRMNS